MRADRRVAVLRLELDDPHPAEVGADDVDVVAQRRRDVRVRRPQRVLVGLALVPEAAAVELRRRRRRAARSWCRRRSSSPCTRATRTHSARHVEVGVGRAARNRSRRARQAQVIGVQRDLDRPVVLVRPEGGLHGPRVYEPAWPRRRQPDAGGAVTIRVAGALAAGAVTTSVDGGSCSVWPAWIWSWSMMPLSTISSCCDTPNAAAIEEIESPRWHDVEAGLGRGGRQRGRGRGGRGQRRQRSCRPSPRPKPHAADEPAKARAPTSVTVARIVGRPPC